MSLKYISLEDSWHVGYPYVLVGRYFNHAGILCCSHYELWICQIEAENYIQALILANDDYVYVNGEVCEEELEDGIISPKLVHEYALIKNSLGY